MDVANVDLGYGFDVDVDLIRINSQFDTGQIMVLWFL